MKPTTKYLSLISYGMSLLLLCSCGTPASTPSLEGTAGPGITTAPPSDSSDTITSPPGNNETVSPDTATPPETEPPASEVQPTTDATAGTPSEPVPPPETTVEATPTPEPTPVTGLRGSTSYCYVPTADGTAETHNDYASIDYSHASEGYIMARYTGTCPKVKMQIKYPGAVTYTYNLVSDDYEAFPLSSGSGTYEITILENVVDTSYLISLTTTIEVNITNSFGPYLYPNQYCNFTSSSQVVAKAAKLSETANSDLDVVANVYNYVISSITYDYDKAQTVPSGYTADVDAILNSGTGICLDYAAVMASMLRSQQIPTRLEVGYVGDAYHAWISTYIKDVGWVNGIVQFDGTSWKLMDPTFAANSSEDELREFIGDGSNYVVKYMY